MYASYIYINHWRARLSNVRHTSTRTPGRATAHTPGGIVLNAPCAKPAPGPVRFPKRHCFACPPRAALFSALTPAHPANARGIDFVFQSSPSPKQVSSNAPRRRRRCPDKRFPRQPPSAPSRPRPAPPAPFCALALPRHPRAPRRPRPLPENFLRVLSDEDTVTSGDPPAGVAGGTPAGAPSSSPGRSAPPFFPPSFPLVSRA